MKRKLQRFAELETFKNVFDKDCRLKGRWNTDFFNNQHPIVLELGCGRGEYTLALARQFPEKNFIGIDIKGARLWRGAKTAIEEEMPHVAFLRIQIESLPDYFSQAELSEIWITFPDPQSSQRRMRKRLTSERFLLYYRKLLKPGGIVHLKTDDQPLFLFSREQLALVNAHSLDESIDIYHDGPNNALLTEIQTTYEKVFLKAGKKICYLQFSFISEELSSSEKSTPYRRNKTSPKKNSSIFYEKVYELTRQIPRGRVCSYGAIARYLGIGSSARMVGYALNHAHSQVPSVPAHRVVNRSGVLTGKHHFGGTIMQQLLENEGIKILNDKVVEFKALHWDPSVDLL